jgi:chloramphenicol 3-O phosphotransferase
MDTLSTIIFLNGASSSGKTCIIKAIQGRSPIPFLDLGLDKFVWMLPKQYLDVPVWHEVFTYEFEEDGMTIRVIHSAPLGDRLISTMHRCILTTSQAKMSILADHVLLEESWVEECADLFHSENAYLIGVRCPLEVLEERERS